jgi:hypothetical protein
MDPSTCTVYVGAANTTMVRHGIAGWCCGAVGAVVRVLRASMNWELMSQPPVSFPSPMCVFVCVACQPQVTSNLVDAVGKLLKLDMDFSDAGAFAADFLASQKRSLSGASPPVCLTYQMSSVSQASSVATIATRALEKPLKPTAFLADPGLLDVVRFKSLRNTEGLEVSAPTQHPIHWVRERGG